MFQQNHRTADGKTLLIAQMEDEHLLNMIGTVVTWAERATSQFRSLVAQAQEVDRWKANGGAAMAEAQRKMYGLPDPPTLHEASDQYGRGMNALAGKLEPYLLEAWTRELSVENEAALAAWRERWTAAVGRNSALPNPNREMLLAPAMAESDDLVAPDGTWDSPDIPF